MKKYEYDEDLDIIYVNNNFDEEKVLGNLVFGNVVIDIGNDGKVLGVEIDCASKVFNMPEKELKDLKVAEIKIMKFGDWITFGVVIGTTCKTQHTFQMNLSKECNRMPLTC